jgi:glycosidase
VSVFSPCDSVFQLSEFGGSAWEWRVERQQYYLHSFAIQQADLNYSSPYVVEEMKVSIQREGLA